MKKKYIRSAAALCTAVSLSLTAIPVYAENDTTYTATKDESVYVVLEADGSLKTVTVSDQLHSDTGFTNYDDASELSDVENLKSKDTPTASQDGYTWNSDSNDIYYQGTSSKDLPLSVKITYQLDGKTVDPSDILGDDGHLKMTISVTNNQEQTYAVNGKIYHLVIPFAVAAGGMLDSDHFSNVTVNEGTVTSDSSHYIAASLMIPGLRSGLSEILDADMMSQLEDYLYDDIVLEADVTDFETPSLMMAAATDTDKLKDAIKDTDLSGTLDQLDELKDATDQLVSGTQELKDGTAELDSNITKLQDGGTQLADGASSLVAGLTTANAGATDLSNGLNTLSSNSSALNAGASQIAQGILDTANTQLSAQGIAALTLDNYADVLGAAMGASAYRDTTLASITAQAGTGSDDNTRVLLYLYATSQNKTADFNNDLATQGARMSNAQDVQTTLVSSQVSDAASALANPSVSAFLTAYSTEEAQGVYDNPTMLQNIIASLMNNGADEASALKIVVYAGCKYTGTSTAANSLTTAITNVTDAAQVQNATAAVQTAAGTQIVNGVLDQVTSSSQTYKDVYAQLYTLEQSLNGVATFVSSLKTYTDGVDSAAAGASDLVSGTGELLAGAQTLKGGLDTLNANFTTLKSGTSALATGASTLLEGMTKYKTDGIAKITDSSEVATLKEASSLLDAIKAQGESYNNYSGISEGTTGNVKFIYKISGVTADKTVSKTATATETTEKKSFWQRLTDLFHISF